MCISIRNGIDFLIKKPLSRNAEGLFLEGLVQYIVSVYFILKTHTTANKLHSALPHQNSILEFVVVINEGDALGLNSLVNVEF